MTTPEKAIDLLHRLDVAVVQFMKSEQRRRGPSKAASQEEDRAAAACFQAMVGRKPTADEVALITNW